MFSRAIFICVLSLLSACAVYDADTLAKQGNWFEIGKYDGDKGLASRSYKELKRLASGGSIDYQSYDAGYQQGIENYCNVDNAYSIGLSGVHYHGVCAHLPDGLRFNMEWQRGYQAHQNSL